MSRSIWHHRNFWIYFGVVSLDSISFGLMAPILAPLLAHRDLFFGSSPHPLLSYGVLIGLFPISYMLASPWMGRLSDRLGRRLLLLACLVALLGGFISYAVAFSQVSLWCLMLGRVLSGVGASSQGIAQAAMMDIANQGQKPKTISWIAIGMSLGLVLGPLIASIWSQSLSLWIFLTVMGFTLLNMVFLAFAIPMPYSTPSVSPKISVTLKKPSLILLLGVFFLFELGWSFFYQSLPVSLAVFWHFNTQQIGHVSAYVGLCLCLFLGFAVQLGLRFFSTRRLVQVALLIGIVGYLWIAKAQDVGEFLAASLLITLAVALIYPLLITLMSEEASGSQGLVIGLSGTLLSLAFAITGLSSGLLPGGPAQLSAIVCAICWILAISLFFFLRKPLNQ